MDEQRKFTRIKFDATALMMAEGERWQVELLDISLRGALFQSAYRENLSVGGEVTALITLASEGGSIEIHGKVLHIHDEHIGVSCEHMDVDSISLLRRIVELNVGDSELLQREIAALIESVTSDVAENDSLPTGE
ncbi:hypothetical protein A9Q89_09735 [Gammaproteobacteria bacterium 53_120_T64]|nr:hypothetical protein A9Q89_09735 [Gammaproteobacteria bacterium 53_120_T64]